MRKLYTIFILGAGQLLAQNVVYLPGDPRHKASSVDTSIPAPSTLFAFTLKKPTQYELPRDLQRMIMNCFKDAPATQVLVWREEYNVVYETKEYVRAWLDAVLIHRLRLLGNEFDRAASIPQKEVLVREITYAKEWREFNLKGW